MGCVRLARHLDFGRVHSNLVGRPLPIKYHPQHGSIVCVRFEPGFTEPEMVKNRLCIVLSRAMGGRDKLVTVVPLSQTKPTHIKPYHMPLVIPFTLPDRWGDHERWVKGDMIYSVGFHRVELLRLAKDAKGRAYQQSPLPDDILTSIRKCVLHGLGMSSLVKHVDPPP